MPGHVIIAEADPVALAQSAARWLSRIRYRVNAQAPAFGPSLPTYHNMADPAAPPEKRLAACRRVLSGVQRHVVVEQVKAEDQPEPYREDPHGIEFGTTERGAILEMIAATLEAAIEALEGR